MQEAFDHAGRGGYHRVEALRARALAACAQARAILSGRRKDMPAVVYRIHRAILGLLLSACYFVIFAPFAVMQLFDPLRIRRTRESMLTPREEARFDSRSACRPY